MILRFIVEKTFGDSALFKYQPLSSPLRELIYHYIDQSLMLSQRSNKATISKIRIDNSMVPNFVRKVDHTL